ncbi:MAG: hypothetical protein QHC90_25910 [Shinella sp.]|nr:hypothetical protein [Shinella sp.]
MAEPANTLRGEADVRIGKIDFRIEVTFEKLIKLSQAIKARTMDEIYVRLLGFEPVAVACAVRTLIVEDDQDRASAVCARVLASDNISAADAEGWRGSIEAAFAGHIHAGEKHRDTRSAHEIAEEAVLGKPASPS